MLVRSSLAVTAAMLLACAPRVARGDETSDRLRLGADLATNWTQGTDRVVLLEQNVSITTDDATLTADRAVIWLSNLPDSGNYTVQIALIGHAKVIRGDLTREGGELFVTIATRPDVQLNVGNLTAADRSEDVHYLAATQLRRQALAAPATDEAPATASTQPAGPRRPRGAAASPVTFQSKGAHMTTTPEGKIALVLNGEVLLVQTRANGDRVELQADNAVLFTQLTDARQLLENDRLKSIDTDRDLDAAYLEGDVRMDVTPAAADRPQQSLRASRIVYEFSTDRAIITDALLHSTDPRTEAPLVVRAGAMKKLGTDQYEARNARLSTSSFATPSIALAASKVSVRQEDSGDRRVGSRTVFSAEHVTPRLYNIPVFYFPWLWGSMTNGGGVPLRDLAISNSTGFGFGVETRWGLFETFGAKPPENTDASYRLDYYSERGPAGGIDASYSGGFVSENSLQPWGFNGNFTSYITEDSGVDRLGKRRRRIGHEEDLRGRVRWDHQHFLTDGWQLQARVGHVSDGTFLEEWFRNEFRNGMPHETSLYLKRAQNTEVFTALVTLDTSRSATVADQLQEITIDEDGQRLPLIVERLPEVGYHRLGDSLFADQATFVSNNSLALLHFSEANYSLQEIGFRNPSGGVDEGFAGIPSYGYTGFTDEYVTRGDFRQEMAWPMGDDRVRVTPYGVVRYTAYSESPAGGAEDRVLAGVGIRSSTQFHKVYDNVDSRLFDVHRLRHVIEPQLNLFASAQTTDRDELYIYDEGIDAVSDLAAAQFVVRQRFQTKRGAPGRQRSVDFFTLNTGVNFFANEPDEVQAPYNTPLLDDAGAFRGTYFSSMPEASIARSTLFADATWRVTDTTALLSDIAWNIEHGTLATTAVGLAVQRDPRLRYFAGVRYIGEVNSTIGTLAFDYMITQRYSLAVNQSFDLTNGTNENTSMVLTRKFEQFIVNLSVFFDQIEDEGGITISVSPRNMPFGFRVSDGSGARR